MIELAILSGVVIAALIILLYLVWEGARKERASLLDRIMALSQPEALILHKAQEEPVEGDVVYMDEAAEAAAYKRENGNVELLGDD